MLNSILKVRSQGVDMVQEGFGMLAVAEMVIITCLNIMTTLMTKGNAISIALVFNKISSIDHMFRSTITL